MKATVYKDRCNGCTICNITCPDVFGIGDDGKALVKATLIPRHIADVCLEAADECPSNAILVEETMEAYFPSMAVAGYK